MRINHPTLITNMARLSSAIGSEFPATTHAVAVHHLVAEAALDILADSIACNGDERPTADRTRGRLD